MKQFEFPQAALEQHIAILGKAGSGKTVTAKGIAEGLLTRSARVVVVDPTGVWWGMKSSADGKKGAFPMLIFGGRKADVPLNEKNGEALAELIGTSPTSAIIDTSLMKVGERTRFFADFANGLLRVNEGPLWVFIDEAHLFAPQGKVSDPQSGNMLHAANNLVSLGRARGLRVTMISQRPAKLHKDSLTQVETLVALRLIAPQDRDAVKSWIADQADVEEGKRIIASLPTLPTGTGWVWAPEIGILEKVKFPMIKTFDSSKAPGAGWNDTPPTMAAISIKNATDHLKIFEEELKANDPSTLRAEIKKLQRELDNKGAFTEAKVREVESKSYQKGKKEGFIIGFKEAEEGLLNKLDDLIDQHRSNPSIAPPPFDENEGDEILMSDMPTFTIKATKPLPIHVNVAPDVYGKSPGLEVINEPSNRVKNAVGFWASIQRQAPTRAQVAAVAGYKAGSGNFNNILSKLRTQGMIDVPEPGRLNITAAAEYKKLSREEARTMFLKTMTAPQQKILNALVGFTDCYRDEIAKTVGYAPKSGNYNNLISSLCTLEALEKPRAGVIRLSDWARDLLEG